MSAPLFIGIDGGASSLRVALVDDDLTPLSSLSTSAANPNVIGQRAAQAHIRSSLRQLLERAGRQASEIRAAGIGIAGASNRHSEQWLVETLGPVLPSSLIVASSDLEIALVGALAQRQGILILAGTGSAAFGIAPDGRQRQVGGWGYMLGDEGSSVWLGKELLRAIIRSSEGNGGMDRAELHRRCLDELGLSQTRDLIAWLYRADEAPAQRLAGLAPFLLRTAADGNREALRIVNSAAYHLVGQVELIQRRPEFKDGPIAFAGGLLDNDNVLSREVAAGLGLSQRPCARHAPVIGAALLARLEWRAQDST